MATIAFKNEGDGIFVIGDSNGHLGQSIWLRELHGREDGAPPPVDLAKERAHAEYVRQLIQDGTVNAVHDVADGGLLVTLTEMALASGRGCVLKDIDDAATAFGEDQARFIVTTAHADLMQAAGIPIRRIGTVSGHAVTGRDFSVAIADLRTAHDSFFKDWMEG